jgi:hypothetical protein
MLTEGSWHLVDRLCATIGRQQRAHLSLSAGCQHLCRGLSSLRLCYRQVLAKAHQPFPGRSFDLKESKIRRTRRQWKNEETTAPHDTTDAMGESLICGCRASSGTPQMCGGGHRTQAEWESELLHMRSSAVHISRDARCNTPVA